MLRRHLLFPGDGLFLGFNPFMVGLPSLWLSSRYPASLWKERTTPTSQAILNGDVVGTWMDLSGNARHVTAPSDAARPTLATGSLGGWPGLLCDGTDDVLINDTVASLLSGTGKELTIISVASSSADGGVSVSFGSSSSFTPFLAQYPLRTSKYAATYRNDANNEVDRLVGTASSGVASIGATTLSATTVTTRVNGGTPGSGAIAGTAITVHWFTLGAFRRNGAASGYLNGRFYELLIYPSVLTDTQLRYIERGLGRAYGITVA